MVFTLAIRAVPFHYVSSVGACMLRQSPNYFNHQEIRIRTRSFGITRRQTTHDENELHFLSRRMPLLPRNKRISTKKSETLTLVATEARFTRITMAPPLTTKTLFPTIRVRVLCPVVSHIPAFIAIKSKDHSEK